MMKNIALTLGSWHIGGIESCMYRIAQKLQNDFNFYFVALDNKDIHPRYAQIGETIYLGHNWDAITKYLKQKQIDIVQWSNIDRCAECASRAGVKKIIERIAGPRSLNKNHSYNTHVISSSYGIMRQLKAQYSGPTTVIHNGIETYPDIRPQKIFDKGFIVCYPAARMGEGQNYQMLIKSVIEARKQNPNIKLILMGDTPKLAGYKSIKKQLKILTKPIGKDCAFTGFVADPLRIIAGSNLIAVTGKTHGISNALIEGSALGRPIISTAVGQASEICHHGENGYLVRLNDYSDLAKKIVKLADSPAKCKAFGEYGQNLVDHQFNIDKQAEKYRQLYIF